MGKPIEVEPIEMKMESDKYLMIPIIEVEEDKFQLLKNGLYWMFEWHDNRKCFIYTANAETPFMGLTMYYLQNPRIIKHNDIRSLWHNNLLYISNLDTSHHN